MIIFPFGKYFAALAAVPDFTTPITGFLDGAPAGRIELPAMLCGVQQRLRVLAQSLVTAVAGNIGKGVVDLDDQAFRIRNDDAFAGMAEHAAGQHQFFFGRFALGDVACNKDKVLVQADRGTAVEKVVTVLDIAKRLGVGKLGVGVTPDEK